MVCLFCKNLLNLKLTKQGWQFCSGIALLTDVRTREQPSPPIKEAWKTVYSLPKRMPVTLWPILNVSAWPRKRDHGWSPRVPESVFFPLLHWSLWVGSGTCGWSLGTSVSALVKEQSETSFQLFKEVDKIVCFLSDPQCYYTHIPKEPRKY